MVNGALAWHPVGNMIMKKGEVVLKKRGILLTERADLRIRASEQHMLFILNVTGITDITHRRVPVGSSSLFNTKSVNPKPEPCSVAQDMMRKIQEHVFGH